MESVGEEKRIQALFSETTLHDRSTAPAFEKVWTRAEICATPARVHINSKFVLAIAAALLITVSFAVWSLYKSTLATTHDARILSQPVVTPSPQPAPQLALQSKHREIKTRPKRFTRAAQSQRATINNAALLSDWQSPTELLMQFSKTVDLSSLPQLNQSAEALKQFLPANTDLKKESNQ